MEGEICCCNATCSVKQSWLLLLVTLEDEAWWQWQQKLSVFQSFDPRFFWLRLTKYITTTINSSRRRQQSAYTLSLNGISVCASRRDKLYAFSPEFSWNKKHSEQRSSNYALYRKPCFSCTCKLLITVEIQVQQFSWNYLKTNQGCPTPFSECVSMKSSPSLPCWYRGLLHLTGT